MRIAKQVYVLVTDYGDFIACPGTGMWTKGYYVTQDIDKALTFTDEERKEVLMSGSIYGFEPERVRVKTLSYVLA